MAKRVLDRADTKQPRLATVQANAADLPAPDAALVQRWMAEAGQERFVRLIAALVAPRDGRPTELEQRMPLLLEMAARIHKTQCTPNAAATKVSTSDAAKPFLQKGNLEANSLRVWLMRYWGKNGTRLMNAVARNEQRPKVRHNASANAFEAYRLASMVDIKKIMPGYESMLALGKILTNPGVPLIQAMQEARLLGANRPDLASVLANPEQK